MRERVKCHGKYGKGILFVSFQATGQSEVWAYFEGHAVTLIRVVHSLLIGFAHFGDKVLHRLTQDPGKRRLTKAVSLRPMKDQRFVFLF